ncbi:MAG TPA: hypothetical protein VNH22_11210 [Blastocatellia bacterium]|jgi:hypothetical protein|nr:hypothetical protein [Blastocatellia bacterium]
MAESDKEAGRGDCETGREEYNQSQGYERDGTDKAAEGESEGQDEVGYSHGYYGGFGRGGRMFGDRTEDVSDPDREDAPTGDQEK